MTSTMTQTNRITHFRCLKVQAVVRAARKLHVTLEQVCTSIDTRDELWTEARKDLSPNSTFPSDDTWHLVANYMSRDGRYVA